MPRRITGFLAAVALQVVALVLAHDLVYLVRFGSRYGEALAHTGHGETWTMAVGTTLVIAVALFAAGVARLVQLGVLVRAASPRASAQGSDRNAAHGALEVRRLVRTWLRIAPRVALVGVVLLTVQESLERSAIGGSVPGPWILLSVEYPWALWITIAVGLVVGLVAGLFEWRRLALLERLRAARAALPRRRAIAAPRPNGVPWRPVESVLGRRSGLRAPPQPSPA